MNKETIEIPLVKATYEELQEVICELQVERIVKDKEIERLNNIIEQIIEYIEYSLKNKDSDERLILQIVLARLKVELKEGK